MFSSSTRKHLRSNLEARVKQDLPIMEAEDAAVAKAWIAVSEEASVGFDKNGDVFYCVNKNYLTKYMPLGKPSRTPKSIKNRAKIIIESRIELVSCFTRIVQVSPSATSEKDNVRFATAIYNDRKLSTPFHDVGPKFQFPGAFEVFARHLKFQMTLKSSPKCCKEKKMKSNNESTSSSDRDEHK